MNYRSLNSTPIIHTFETENVPANNLAAPKGLVKDGAHSRNSKNMNEAFYPMIDVPQSLFLFLILINAGFTE